MSQKKKKDSTNLMILFLSFSNIAGNALTIISGILVARWLLPEDLGFYNSFTIITGYIILAHLGIPAGLGREFPLFMGKKDVNTAHRYASVTQFWQLTLGLLTLGVSLLVTIYYLLNQKPEYAAGTFVIGILSFQSFYITKYLKVLYRSNSDFNRLSQLGLIVSFASFISIYFVWKLGFYGLCVRAALLVVVDLFFTWLWCPVKVRPAWDKTAFRELFNVGFTMYVVANIYGLWPLLQRTIVLSLGGVKSLGLFAIAILVDNAMKTVTGAISNVTYPKMVVEWGQGATVRNILTISFKPLLLALMVFAIAVPIGWMVLPTVIKLVLPNYIEAIPAARWMLIAGYIGMLTGLGNIYNVIQKQRDRFVYFSSGILGWLCTVYSLYFLNGFSLDIFPKAMCVGLCAMLLVNLFHISKYCALSRVS